MDQFKKSIIGSVVAFFLATSCCWLPAILVAVGGGSALIGWSENLNELSSVFLIIGISLLGYGLLKIKSNKGMSEKKNIILQSVITCPSCGHQKEETMPTDACQFFYECESCHTVLKPKPNDCCVYCSYGTVPCPPIQLNQSCC